MLLSVRQGPSADFLDDGAIVPVAFTRLNTTLHHFDVDLREGQSLTSFPRVLPDDFEIFQALYDLTGSDVISLNHLHTFYIHGLGIRSGVARDIQKGMSIQAESSRRT